MTPDEARTKWCPFARVGLIVPDTPGAAHPEFAINRYVAATVAGKALQVGVAQGASCIADACMAWRWIVSPKAIPKAEHEHGPGRAIPSGYCGLAGAHGLD
jgi:hypothetical protein